jgi:hypothetical protein
VPVSNRLPARLVGLSLLCVFCSVSIYGRLLEAQRNRPFGLFNERQITEQADAVRSALMTSTEEVATTVKRLGREFRDGSVHPFWYVDYSNRNGDSVLRLGFDAETGNLHFAELCPGTKTASLSQFARPGRLASADKVLKLSRDWVYALKLAPKMGPWNVTCPPKQKKAIWRVVWQCRDHTLNFSFDKKTGRLLLAQVRV